jgi:hypothetical protein
MKILFSILSLFLFLLSQGQPTANAGKDTTIPFPTGSYKLVGKGSGQGIKYKWNVLRTTLPAANDSVLTFDAYNMQVTYRLTVTDMFNKTAIDDVVVTLKYDSTFASFNYDPSRQDTVKYQYLLYVQKGASYTTPKKKENSLIVRKEESGKIVWYDEAGKLIEPFMYKSVNGYWLQL